MSRLIIVAFFAGASAFASAPTITTVSPAALGTAGGEVTLTGTGFASGATVKVGNYSCDNLVVVSATEITCSAPENIARKSGVSILNSDGGTAALSAGVTYAGTPGLALLEARVFTRTEVNAQGTLSVYKCAGCHTGARPAAGLDTTLYSDLAANVVAGNPAGSNLYKEISSGKMPPGPGTPSLTPEEVQAISDWITAGAQND